MHMNANVKPLLSYYPRIAQRAHDIVDILKSDEQLEFARKSMVFQEQQLLFCMIHIIYKALSY